MWKGYISWQKIILPEFSEDTAICGTEDIELTGWWEDTAAGEADPLGFVNLAWSEGFYGVTPKTND